MCLAPGWRRERGGSVLRFWWLVVLVAGLLGAGGARAESVLENAGYTFCVNDANDAMSLGRMVMVFSRSQAELEADPKLPPYIRTMAGALFQAIKAGQAPSYVHFARQRLANCLAEQKLALEVSPDQVSVCLTRVDIPYFFFLERGSGTTLEAAIPKLESGLAGWRYPEGLIRVLAEPSWRARNLADIAAFQIVIFNSCLLPPDEVSRFYGTTPH